MRRQDRFAVVLIIGLAIFIIFGIHRLLAGNAESDNSETLITGEKPEIAVATPAKKIEADIARSTPPANSQDAVAAAVGIVPGAILCQDYDTVSLMYDLYAESWGENMQYKVTRGQSKLIHGDPMPPPDLAAHGCILVQAGTPLKL